MDKWSCLEAATYRDLLFVSFPKRIENYVTLLPLLEKLMSFSQRLYYDQLWSTTIDLFICQKIDALYLSKHLDWAEWQMKVFRTSSRCTLTRTVMRSDF